MLGEFDLSDGSALRVGTVEWLTPKRREIWHQGIAPDVPVKLGDGVLPMTPDDLRRVSAGDVAKIPDTQLARASRSSRRRPRRRLVPSATGSSGPGL